MFCPGRVKGGQARSQHQQARRSRLCVAAPALLDKPAVAPARELYREDRSFMESEFLRIDRGITHPRVG